MTQPTLPNMTPAPAAATKPPSPKITAIAPWFGSKRSLAPVICAELGKHTAYWEPCCGSLAVLMAKDRSAHETVNDLHGDLTNLARVLADAKLAPQLYDRLRRTLFCEGLVLDAQRAVATELPADHPADLERAHKYFLAVWAGRSGTAGMRKWKIQIAVRWTPNGGSGSTRFRNAVESIPDWHERLRYVEILRRDLFSILPRIHDQAGVVLYVDPPYFKRGARSGHDGYLYEFQTGDHANLAEQLRRFRQARVVVSYYDDEALADLYPGWTKRRVYRQKNLHVQNRRGSSGGSKRTAPEVLMINGPSYGEDDA